MEILYWVLPIVFAIIEIFLIRFNDSFCLDDNKSIWSFVIPIIDGGILCAFQIFTFKILKIMNINFSTYKEFMYAIIILHCIVLCILLFAIFTDEIDIPILHIVVYCVLAFVIIFIGAAIFGTAKFSTDLDKIDFEYQKTEIINLSSMSGDIGESGILKGNYRYLNFVLEGSYRIYYVQKEDDGNLVIDYIDYDKDNVKIYERDDEVPRIEINHYKKELINPENGEVIVDSSHKEYVFYIPVGTYENKFESGF